MGVDDLELTLLMELLFERHVLSHQHTVTDHATVTHSLHVSYIATLCKLKIPFVEKTFEETHRNFLVPVSHFFLAVKHWVCGKKRYLSTSA